jgi:dipeptidase D
MSGITLLKVAVLGFILLTIFAAGSGTLTTRNKTRKMILKDITPQVWKYFEEICRIPRPSKKEEKIGAYIRQLAQELQLACKHDEVGNILIGKPATPGMEHLPTVILQSHIDMVCEKDSHTHHNFDTDPIVTYTDGHWMKARGTTLGADDGIGVATMLTILADPDITHGPIEALFTVDEETGLTGAKALHADFLTGKILINLDSEDEGQLFVGCAGGIDTIATFTYKHSKIPPSTIAYQIAITGMTGGHSGDDINKRRGNAIKILNHLLLDCSSLFGISICRFEGGNLRNAIPREASAIVMVDTYYRNDFEQYCASESQLWKEALTTTSPGFCFTIEPCDTPMHIMDIVSQSCLLNSLALCPSGVVAMSETIPGMVSTSTNIASVKFTDDNSITIATSQRGDRNDARMSLNKRIRRIFAMMGAQVDSPDGYPGWTPNPKSPILETTKAAYSKLFGQEPAVKTIHAGLECGLFLEKYPHLDMISFGPTIKNPHSPTEQLHIPSVERFTALLLRVLNEVKIDS